MVLQSSLSFASELPYVGIIAFNLFCHWAEDIFWGKHFFKTSGMMETAVDAPSDAPNNTASEPSAAYTTYVPALLQASELSAAAAPSLSKMPMLQVGSNAFTKVPGVALIIPAPVKIICGWVLSALVSMLLSA